jgi:glycosyltransferase involved in cell wall biosynthesis
MAAPRVSAIVPNYNHGRLLPTAIAGLQAQTRPYDEILVVDDGSTDDSLTVIEGLVACDPRIRLIRQAQNKGTVAAMNAGLAASDGGVIHFAAADDAFRPSLVATLLPCLESFPRAAFASAEVILVQAETGRELGMRPPVRPSGVAAFLPPSAVAAALRRIDNFIITQTTLFRRAPLVAAGGFDERLDSFTDGVLARRLALTHGFCFVPQVLAEWRVAESGYSRTLARDADRALAALSTVLAAFSASSVFPPWYPPLFERRWRFAVARLAIETTPPDRAVLRRILGDSRVVDALLALPAPIRRLALLALLTFRFRPTSLSRLLGTMLARRHERSQRPVP